MPEVFTYRSEYKSQVVQPTSHSKWWASQPHPFWNSSGETQHPQVSGVQCGVWGWKCCGRCRPGGKCFVHTHWQKHTYNQFIPLRFFKHFDVCDWDESPVLQVFATGYRFSFPFLASHVTSVSGNKVSLYKYVFPPELERPTLAIIGLVQPLGAIMPISEMQARWATRVFKGNTGCKPFIIPK